MSGMQKGLNEEHVNLSSLKDAEEFLKSFHWYDDHLKESITCLQKITLPNPGLTPEYIRGQVVKHWNGIMSRLPLEQQQDRLFQNTLTAALENFLLSQIHEQVFHQLCVKHKEEDSYIWNHCISLTRINISAEKLGVPDGFAISFPAAVVELAALDTQCCPLDKLRCLRTTLEYLQADIKCAVAEMHALTPGEVLTPDITSDDMVPILAAVLVQSKPSHIASNLHYMESYQVTLTPCDPLCSSLVTFQKAVSHLLSVNVNDKETECPKLGRGISKEIKLEEIAELIKHTEKLSDKTEQITPLDCHLTRMVDLIDKSMREHDTC